MNAESSQYTHGLCLNCNRIRPVQSIRVGNDEHARTNIIWNECNFIMASLYKRPAKLEFGPEHATGRSSSPRRAQ